MRSAAENDRRNPASAPAAARSSPATASAAGKNHKKNQRYQDEQHRGIGSVSGPFVVLLGRELSARKLHQHIGRPVDPSVDIPLSEPGNHFVVEYPSRRNIGNDPFETVSDRNIGLASRTGNRRFDQYQNAVVLTFPTDCLLYTSRCV